MSTINPSTLVCIVLLAAFIGGCWLCWDSRHRPSPKESGAVPDIYTVENVRAGVSYHVEQDGRIQNFEVLSVHWSGNFLIRVLPPESHKLDRDYPTLVGWAGLISANKLIEAHHLVKELPLELRFRAN